MVCYMDQKFTMEVHLINKLAIYNAIALGHSQTARQQGSAPHVVQMVSPDSHP